MTTHWIEVDFGRDKGMAFQITEMSAWHSFEWGSDAIRGIGRNGVDIPDDLPGGMAGLVVLFKDKYALKDFVVSVVVAICKIPKDDFNELRDRLFACIKRSSSGQQKESDLQNQWIEQITDPRTFPWLLQQAFEKHVAFFLEEERQKSEAETATT